MIFSLLLPVLALAVTDSGNVPDCHALAKDKCMEFRGRASAAMGRAGTRIWKIGSKRIYEVQKQTPDAFAELHKVDFHTRMFAQFEACLLEEPQEKGMQGICVQKVNKVKVEAIK